MYQHLSGMIAGSQEYMAMEKLFEVVSEGEYDLVVIDTPPTVHAIDFLEAPDRMVNALTNSMIHVLLKPVMMAGKSGFKLLERGSQMMLKLFDRITGFAVLQDISELLNAFRELLDGFTGRAADVKKILGDSETSFIMVAACEEKSVDEAEIFQQKLKDLSLPMDGIILNRVHPLYSISRAQRDQDEDALAKEVGKPLARKMTECFERYQTLARRDQQYRQTLAQQLDQGQFLATVPLFETDVHDLEGLYRLGESIK
jgi:anion-transporting  ArsA/GET3 family ATPase